MSERTTSLSRRAFLKLTGAAGAGSIVASMAKFATASGQAGPSGSLKVPTRPFGNTGVRVPMLGLGGSQDLMSKQLLLRQAVRMGVTYWDTAYRYEGGNSEKAIGKYFRRFPEDREKVFLVTKTPSSDPAAMTRYLETSLERLNTSYVDLYFIHSVSDVRDEIDRETREWVDAVKAENKIRFFGFSTHKNMAQCLMDGAKLGWIDGIMASYNYRLMHADEMKRAVEACVEAGIGLTAMKTQAKFLAYFYADIGKEGDTAAKLAERFMERGFTTEQARLKAVWENPAIACICSEMPNMTVLQANVAAALDQTSLSRLDKQMMEEHAQETAFGYCAGCGTLCESMMEEEVPITDVLRSLMYHNGYGNREKANQCFQRIPMNVRNRLALFDYSRAEGVCPQKIPIGKMMQQASLTFSERPG